MKSGCESASVLCLVLCKAVLREGLPPFTIWHMISEGTQESCTIKLVHLQPGPANLRASFQQPEKAGTNRGRYFKQNKSRCVVCPASPRAPQLKRGPGSGQRRVKREGRAGAQGTRSAGDCWQSVEPVEQNLGKQWSVSWEPWERSIKVLLGNCKDLVSVKCH